MWVNVGLSIAAILVILITHWIIKWRNPKCNGVLPPGSMGLPFIGETLHLLIPSYSLDLHPFIKNRIQRYGSVFRTSLAGRPVVISADPELNNYVLSQEGKLVELFYLDTFSKICKHEGESRTNEAGGVHKYVRSTFLSQFGAEMLREKLIPQIEDFVTKTLNSWSSQDSVEVKLASSLMVLNFSAKQMFSYDAEKSSFNLGEKYTRVRDGLFSFPINIPGTTYYKCQQDQKKVTDMLKDIFKEKRRDAKNISGENDCKEKNGGGDLLDRIIRDMEKENFLSEEFIVQLLYVGIAATFESVSVIVALAFLLLEDHPHALQEMIAEQEAVLNKKRSENSPNRRLNWDDYKSMTFTLQVINETLRLGNGAPGLLRKALKDIEVKGKGYTIPAGWSIMLVTSALHMNPNTFDDPLQFNPWRWKELESHIIPKNFMPFGGGTRQCAGAEYSRVFLSLFFHVLLTKYRWTIIKREKVARNPVIGFGKGVHIKFSHK
ncbi:hypothetical protein FEM48_Zijuj04G0199500 [Ziziphus jujuba var. spinosa]|nr:hypothetical protein FEM48_Zijuj04G0199500 [Ziziphus jujuba var. spinosa]